MLNNFKVWIALLIILGGLAFWVTQTSDTQSVHTQKPLLTAWQGDENSTHAIKQIILTRGGEQLILNKTEDAWQLNDGFYAAIEPLIQLIRSFQVAEIIEAKTSNPSKHDTLDLAADDLLVKLVQSDQSQHAFYIGKQSASGLTFVRREGEDQTYTVKGLAPISFNKDSWRLKTVLDITAEEIQAVTLKPFEGNEVIVSRNPEGGDIITDIPDGYKLKSGAYLDQLFNGLARLSIDEAIKTESMSTDVSELPIQLTAIYQLNSGQKIELKVYLHDEAYIMSINSEQLPQYKDWLMKIADFKFKALNRQMSEFIEPIVDENSSSEEAESELNESDSSDG